MRRFSVSILQFNVNALSLAKSAFKPSNTRVLSITLFVSYVNVVLFVLPLLKVIVPSTISLPSLRSQLVVLKDFTLE